MNIRIGWHHAFNMEMLINSPYFWNVFIFINMGTLTVKEGKHDYKPTKFWIGRGEYHFRYHVSMGADNEYDLVDNDQLDWNKGGGISNYLWSNHKMSAMWAFRCNPLLKTFEMCGYFHNGNEILYPGRIIQPNKVVVVGYDEEIIIDVYMVKGIMEVTFFTSNMQHLETYLVKKYKDRRWCREIGAWFGGNEVAPRKLSMDVCVSRHRL